MSHTTITGLWATDDGSYGEGEVTIVDTSKWSWEQLSWYNKLADEGEVYAKDLQNIANNIKPETL
jgi:hypothetical protein